MAAFLIVQRGEDIGRRFDLDTTQLTVGRGSDNDMVLNDPMVSRYHAVVKRQGSGYLVIDLGSSNPVVINDQVCDPGEPRVLQHRDVVFIGKTVFSFQNRGVSGNTGAGARPQAIDRTTIGVQVGSSAESDSPTPPPPSRQPSNPVTGSASLQEGRPAPAMPSISSMPSAPAAPVPPPTPAEPEDSEDDKTMVAGVVRNPESSFAPFTPPPPPPPTPGLRALDDYSTRPTPGMPLGGNTPPPPPPFSPPRPAGAGAPPAGNSDDDGDGDMPTQIVPRRP